MIHTNATFAALTLTVALSTALTGPALAGTSKAYAKSYVCPPVHSVAHRAVHHAMRSESADRAYAQSFYDYRSASRVGRYFRAPWVEAPHDGHVARLEQNRAVAENYQGGDAGYSGGYYQQDYGHNPELDRGFNGGVGYNMENQGGGGGGGTAVLAGGQNGNGPTYNSYGQSFPYGGADTYAASTNYNWRNSSIPVK